MASQATRDAHRVRDRISTIEGELSELADFREFGASTDLHYQMTDARMAGLRAEREHLKEVLGDL